jgi:hypothetical protein
MSVIALNSIVIIALDRFASKPAKEITVDVGIPLPLKKGCLSWELKTVPLYGMATHVDTNANSGHSLLFAMIAAARMGQL